jgi:hypothetical protein
METWSAGTRTVVDTCLDEIENSDVVILIVIHRSGSVDESGKPIFEIEYDHAKEVGMDVLAFVGKQIPPIDPGSLVPKEIERLQAFLDRLGPEMRGEFRSADELGTLVLQSLINWKQEKKLGRKSRLTIGQVIDEYFRIKVKEQRADTQLEKHIILDALSSSLGHLEIHQAGPMDLLRWLESQTSWETHNTRKGRLNVVMGAFRWAERERRIQKNPFEDRSGQFYDEFLGKPDPNAGYGSISDVDLGKFLRHCRSPRLKRPVLFLKYTRCPVVVMLRLTWNQIIQEENVIRTLVRAREPMIIPIPQEVVEIFNEIRAEQLAKGTYAPEGHVFRQRRGKPWNRQSFRSSWELVATRAGVEHIKPSGLTARKSRRRLDHPGDKDYAV